MKRFIVTILTCLIVESKLIAGSGGDETFEFTRVEPGNQLGITTKVIAHIHRPAKTTIERWTLNREFTPHAVVKALNATCSKKLIDRTLKWENCKLDKEGFTAELTHGRPETKNKTFVYLAVSYATFVREEKGKKKTCILALVEENPVYFLVETFSKIPSNDSYHKSVKESVDVIHLHQLGQFGKEFLSIYGDSIDQDGIYNFDVMDYYDRDELYECFLSIGSSESASVLEEKCPFACLEEMNNSDAAEELLGNDVNNNVYIMRKLASDNGDSEENQEESDEYSSDDDEDAFDHNVDIHNEL